MLEIIRLKCSSPPLHILVSLGIINSSFLPNRSLRNFFWEESQGGKNMFGDFCKKKGVFRDLPSEVSDHFLLPIFC